MGSKHIKDLDIGNLIWKYEGSQLNGAYIEYKRPIGNGFAWHISYPFGWHEWRISKDFAKQLDTELFLMGTNIIISSSYQRLMHYLIANHLFVSHILGVPLTRQSKLTILKKIRSLQIKSKIKIK